MPREERDLKAIGDLLHARLLDEGSAAVKQELAERFLSPLVARLRRNFPNLGDPHLSETAAIDALIDYFGRPERFDPRRGDLLLYLYVIASRDLLNAMDKERREAAKRMRADAQAAPLAMDSWTIRPAPVNFHRLTVD